MSDSFAGDFGVQEQMEVIGHQHEREELPTSGADRAFQDIHPLLAIAVGEDIVSADISASHDVINIQGNSMSSLRGTSPVSR